jgi:hypothetical protein
MIAAEPDLPPWRFAPVLAGAGAGVLGSAAVVLVEILSATWQHLPWWRIPNLYATALIGPRALGEGPGWHTVAGLALQTVLLGAAGALYGWLTRHWRDHRFLVGGALVYGILWFFFAQSVVWRTLSPLIARQAPWASTFAGYLLFGLVLGVSIRFLWPLPVSAPPPAPMALESQMQSTGESNAEAGPTP